MNNNPELPPQSEVSSIACLMLNGIGDTICVTPAIAALKEHYPDAELTILIRPNIQDLVSGNPNIDNSIVYDTKNGLLKRLSFFVSIYRKRFDLWVDLHVPTYNTVSTNNHNFFRNSILMRTARTKYQIAYDVPVLSAHLSHPVPVPSDDNLRKINIVDTTLALASPPPGNIYTKYITVRNEDRDWVTRHLPEKTNKRLGLFFGSEQPADLWPMEHIFVLLKLLREKYKDIDIVIIGSAHERELSQKIDSYISTNEVNNLFNFIEKASLSQTGALMEACDAFVATDSGPMHMADALQIPIVVLLSSKNYVDIWRPITAESKILNHAVDCGPCLKRVCDKNNECMRLISPLEVISMLDPMLSI